jgi:hypothetical protein
MTELRWFAAVAMALAAAGCGPAAEQPTLPGAETVGALDPLEAEIALALEREAARIAERARAVDALFQPLPLLRPAQENELRSYLERQQLVAARRLGIPPDSPADELERMERAGRLVRLPDTTELWIVRELDYSVPLVTPDAEALLRELAERFQAALAELDVPPYRLEVTSVLRSAEDQARLRRVNPNAAAGESTHQYGTTFDVAYSAFAPPARPLVEPALPEAPALVPHLERHAALAAEVVAARRSRELQAILGRVLLTMQQEGKVMVTLERLQPVYHMTVARALAGG